MIPKLKASLIGLAAILALLLIAGYGGTGESLPVPPNSSGSAPKDSSGGPVAAAPTYAPASPVPAQAQAGNDKNVSQANNPPEPIGGRRIVTDLLARFGWARRF